LTHFCKLLVIRMFSTLRRRHWPSQRRPRGHVRDRVAGSHQFAAVTVNSHGLITSLASSCIREYQVSCQGYTICRLWLRMPATIQDQNQRSDVCVRAPTLISSEDSMNGILPVKIVKVLGEGGFSFVYLAQDEASGVSASSSGNYFMGHSH
jgi:hypothetical protein